MTFHTAEELRKSLRRECPCLCREFDQDVTVDLDSDSWRTLLAPAGRNIVARVSS